MNKHDNKARWICACLSLALLGALSACDRSPTTVLTPAPATAPAPMPSASAASQ